MSDLEQDFVNLVRSGRTHEQLLQMVLRLAKLENSSLNIEACEARLDTLVLQANARLGASDSSEQRAAQLCRFLAHEQTFLGNSADYYNPENSNIDTVLRTHRGIPISLAFIYIHLARSMGWLARGVAFPGHFLVAVYEADSQPGRRDNFTLLDPFGGQVMTRADCLAMLKRQYGGTADLQERFFYAADNAEFIRRMLGNLKHCYIRAEAHADALRLVNLLLRISPADVAELHDRAAILEHMHCYSAAAADLQSISEQRPDHPRLSEIRSSIERLEQRSPATLH